MFIRVQMNHLLYSSQFISICRTFFPVEDIYCHALFSLSRLHASFQRVSLLFIQASSMYTWLRLSIFIYYNVTKFLSSLVKIDSSYYEMPFQNMDADW